MKLSVILRLATRAIVARGTRTLIAGLAYFVTSAGLVSVGIIGGSLRSAVLNTFSSLGADTIYITSRATREGTVSHVLRDTDARNLAERVAGIDSVGIFRAIGGAGSTSLQSDGGRTVVQLLSCDKPYLEMAHITLSSGRRFSADEFHSGRRVVLLSSAPANFLRVDFRREKPMVSLAGDWFEVVGVVAPDSRLPGISGNNFALITRDADEAIYGDESPINIAVRIRKEVTPDHLAKRIARELRWERGTTNAEDDNFDVLVASDIISGVNKAINAAQHSVWAVLGTTVATCCLGIMQAALGTTIERRSEIGILKAVGIHRSEILCIFIFESTVICLVGTGLGILAGMTIGLAVATFIPCSSSTALIVPACLLAFIVCLAASGLSTLAGAAQAADLEPVDALRAN